MGKDYIKRWKSGAEEDSGNRSYFPVMNCLVLVVVYNLIRFLSSIEGLRNMPRSNERDFVNFRT